MKRANLIGLFDSGVGGLTVARRVEQDLPEADFLYFGDTKYVPYGARTPQEVIGLINKIARHMVDEKVDVMVMACNTSSALAYDSVVSWCPIPVIGIIGEAAKAAVAESRSGKIGVIANKLTASSGAYERACAAYCQEVGRAVSSVQVFPMGCPKLVPLIEAGQVESDEARQAVNEYVDPLIAQGIDTLVLGCTHYPFLYKLLRERLGPEAVIIDPADYVVRRLREMGFGASKSSAVQRTYQVSGDPEEFARVGSRLLSRAIAPVAHVDL